MQGFTKVSRPTPLGLTTVPEARGAAGVLESSGGRAPMEYHPLSGLHWGIGTASVPADPDLQPRQGSRSRGAPALEPDGRHSGPGRPKSQARGAIRAADLRRTPGGDGAEMRSRPHGREVPRLGAGFE